MPVFNDMVKLKTLLVEHGINPNDAVKRGEFYRNYFDWDDLKRKYEEGSSIKDLCRETNLSYDTIRENLRRNGVDFRKFSYKGVNEYSFKSEYLYNLNEFGAYLVGWLYSDGHVNDNKLTITIQKGDKEHLQYLASIFTEKPIREVSNGVSFDYYNNDLCKFIKREFKIKNRKSEDNYKIDFNKFGEHTPYLLLGLLEGDGCIAKTTSEVQFLIPLKSIKGLTDYLNSNGVNTSKVRLNELNEYGLISMKFKGESYFSILEFIYKNTSKVKPLQRKKGNFRNQVIRSMNGRTSPYKQLAKDVWDSLFS